MLIKTINLKSSGSITPLVKYLLRYQDRSKIKEVDIVAQGHAKLIYKTGTRARTVNGLVKAFRQQETLRLFPKSNNTLLQHTIISFNKLDNEAVTDKVLLETAHKFCELKNELGGETIIAIFQHLDKGHKHIHCASSTVNNTGYSNVLNPSLFAQLKHELSAHIEHTFPEIQHSTVRHGLAKELSTPELIENIKNSRESDKKELLTILENTYKNVTSKEHFLSELDRLGHTHYKRGDTLGVHFNGKKYRLKKLGFDNEKLDKLQVNNERNEILNELQTLREQSNEQEHELSR
ncbi:MAG: relaxase/mobilization nuclease domain-containing protein [Flavipsychrobacter sp.]